jgi:uncharacterized tellurite resistance protein B-like protein
MDLFSELNLNFEQVKELTRGMFAVARADGVHDRELSMIRSFYEGCSRAGDPRFEEVLKDEFQADRARKLFDAPDLAKLFIKTLLLLAYADGEYAKVEDELIRRYAETMGLDGSNVDQLHESTKEFLLRSLAHVQNTEALKDVAKELELKG